MNLICPSGYSQYQQGGRSFVTGNVIKLNDSVLFVHQVVQHSYEQTNDDQYFIYESSGLGNYSSRKDDFDFAPSYNYRILNLYSDGRKLLIGENRNGGVFTYIVDSTYTPISVSKLLLDTTYFSAYNNPILYVNDRIYFAYKNIIGVIDTLGNSCNGTSASVDHGSGFVQNQYFYNLKDSTYSPSNSIHSFQPQAVSRGIFIDDYCNLVGIDNTERKNSFEVFPNPFTDYFEISSADLQHHIYTLMDPLGKIITRINGAPVQVRLPLLSSGVYYLVEDFTGKHKCLIKN